MSKQRKQIARKNENNDLKKDVRDEEDSRPRPIAIVGFVIYVMLGSAALIAFIILSNMYQEWASEYWGLGF